jgi:hypothetical protein
MAFLHVVDELEQKHLLNLEILLLSRRHGGLGRFLIFDSPEVMFHQNLHLRELQGTTMTQCNTFKLDIEM